jgi:signal transduction histidine kinase
LKDSQIEQTKDLTKERMCEIIKKIGSFSIQNEYNETRDILVVKNLIDDNISYIIWERDNNKDVVKDHNACNSFEDALNSFYAMAFQNYAYIRGTLLEFILETIIQETVHESAHFTLPALNVMENKIDFIPYKVFPEHLYPELEKSYDDFKHYKENVIEQLLHLHAVINRPSIIFKEIILEKEEVHIHPLLFKMTKMMSDKANDKYQQIYYNQNQNYVRANLDKLYFDHAVFNLIDNAIKHGYEGTKIYINMIKDVNTIVIEVISYGGEVEQGERIYRLFERGVDRQKTGGMGLGLFVVYKICSAFNGKVTHSSELIYSLNLPVLYCYKHSKNEKLLQDLDEDSKEKVRLKAKDMSPEQSDEVVHNNWFIKYPNVFRDSINNPTFKNTFTITIPIK